MGEWVGGCRGWAALAFPTVPIKYVRHSRFPWPLTLVRSSLRKKDRKTDRPLLYPSSSNSLSLKQLHWVFIEFECGKHLWRRVPARPGTFSAGFSDLNGSNWRLLGRKGIRVDRVGITRRKQHWWMEVVLSLLAEWSEPQNTRWQRVYIRHTSTHVSSYSTT